MEGTIIIADDDETQLALLKSLIGHKKYRLLTANNGQEAIKLARDNRPSLIISDILMPKVDGFTLCHLWHRDPELKNIPFIFYTGTYLDDQDKQLAFDLGADEFLIKPAERRVLLDIIDEYILGNRKKKNIVKETKVKLSNNLLKEYNSALIRKLDDKLVQQRLSLEILETTNMKLRQEIKRNEEQREILNNQIDELQKWYEVSKERELKIFELKKEVNELLKLLGKEPKYKIE
jgi:CheY-like chemotaxis protein